MISLRSGVVVSQLLCCYVRVLLGLCSLMIAGRRDDATKTDCYWLGNLLMMRVHRLALWVEHLRLLLRMHVVVVHKETVVRRRGRSLQHEVVRHCCVSGSVPGSYSCQIVDLLAPWLSSCICSKACPLSCMSSSYRDLMPLFLRRQQSLRKSTRSL